MASLIPVLVVTVALQFTNIQKIYAAPQTSQRASNIRGETEDVDEEDILRYLDDENATESAKTTVIDRLGLSHIQSCSQNTENKKVLGGVEAPQYQQWFVAIHNSRHHGGTFCSGARISPRLVLTAAHCFFDARPDHSPGSQKCEDFPTMKPVATLTLNTGHSENVEINQVIRHKSYSKGRVQIKKNDVAIAILARRFSIPFSPGFCLTVHQHGTGDGNCYAVGIGYTERRDRNPNRQRQKYVHYGTVQVKNCMVAVRGLGLLQAKGIVCTTAGGTKGDSGGPVICERPGNDVPYLMGIISEVRRDENTTILYKATRENERWIESILDDFITRRKNICH